MCLHQNTTDFNLMTGMQCEHNQKRGRIEIQVQVFGSENQDATFSLPLTKLHLFVVALFLETSRPSNSIKHRAMHLPLKYLDATIG